ncbi:hypothetical protein ACFVWG_20735 [Kribbella sp. NPDC058245]|uniref:hypothetical protein n=1 Tax=Kribbella sp. NPDC058245 TaxID=3346399 RepID=UPI0036E96266
MTDPTGGIDGAPTRALFEHERLKLTIENAEELLDKAALTPDGQIDVEAAARLLERVDEYTDDLDLKAGLVQLTLEAATLSGAGQNFQLTNRVVAISTKTINGLLEMTPPKSTTDLLLALARYESTFNTGGHARRRAVQRALRHALNDTERLRALLTLARVEIDVSKYRRARRLISQCRAIAHDASAPFQQQILVTAGMIEYYNDIDRATSLLTEALAAPDDPPQTVIGRQQPRAEALHYLGRIAGDQGRNRDALQLLFAAQEISEGRLTGRGFHNLRVAEILMRERLLDEAQVHLALARKLFAQGQDTGAGEAMLHSAEATHLLLKDDPAAAAKVLRRATNQSRAKNFPRGELLCNARLAKLELKRRNLNAVLTLIPRTTFVLFRYELRDSTLLLLRKGRTLARMARQQLSADDDRTPNRQSVTHCPCAEHVTN